MNQLAVAVDFDGTVAQYTHWEGEAVVGQPIPGALEFIKTLYDLNYEVWIFSARASGVVGREAIWNWIHEHGLRDYVVGVTADKLYRFHRFVDDRAIPFTGSYDDVLRTLKAAA